MPYKKSNPLRLNQQDAAPFPFYYLALLAALYILAGLTWRGLWRQEAASFATMLTMAQGSLSDWIYPNIAGSYTTNFGPLPYWIGALAIKISEGLIMPLAAAQIAIGVQDIVSIYILWLTIYRLGRRDEMQPQRLAFGGEPLAQDYGKMLADSAVLLLISTYGIAAHTHDTSEGATLLMVCLIWLCGAVSSLDRPLTARWLWAFGLAGIGLTLPFGLFIFFSIATLIILFSTHWRVHTTNVAPVVILFGLGLPIAWLLQTPNNGAYFTAWLHQQRLFPLSSSDRTFFIRNIFIFTWPLAPLAVWCLWRWRAQWHSPVIFLGLTSLIAPLLHLLITGQRFEMSMLIFIPALLLLAPFGLATLNRGRANIIDWFSVITFSLLALGIWLMWLASWIGYPQSWVANIYKLAPSFQQSFKWWPFFIALIVTSLWITLLIWRVHQAPRAIWKSIVFSSGGLVLIWTLLATLWMPWLDHTRNYNQVGQALMKHIPSHTSCVRAIGLSEATRGAIYYYAKLPFVPNNLSFDKVTCPYIISNESTLKQPQRLLIKQNISINERSWQVVWMGERVAERNNMLVLLRQN